MKELIDGGPAFPQRDMGIIRHNGRLEDYHGMSTREWYAGMAMQGFIAGGVADHATLNDIAIDAFAAADAMIAEGNK